MDQAAERVNIDIVARLRAFIESSQLPVDSRLPPERELSRRARGFARRPQAGALGAGI